MKRRDQRGIWKYWPGKRQVLLPNLLFAAIGSLTLASSTVFGAQGCGLSDPQIAAAIRRGAASKSADKFLERDLEGVRVKVSSIWGKDDTSKYVTFFNDCNDVAIQSALAHQQLRELTSSDVSCDGHLHAFVQVHAQGSGGASRMNRKYLGDRAHLVIQSGGVTFQPLAKKMIKRADQNVAENLLGLGGGKITLTFDFDLEPSKLLPNAEIILIDGDGKQFRKSADLTELTLSVH